MIDRPVFIAACIAVVTGKTQWATIRAALQWRKRRGTTVSLRSATQLFVVLLSNYAVERTLSSDAMCSARAAAKFARASLAGRVRGAAHGGR